MLVLNYAILDKGLFVMGVEGVNTYHSNFHLL